MSILKRSENDTSTNATTAEVTYIGTATSATTAPTVKEMADEVKLASGRLSDAIKRAKSMLDQREAEIRRELEQLKEARTAISGYKQQKTATTEKAPRRSRSTQKKRNRNFLYEDNDVQEWFVEKVNKILIDNPGMTNKQLSAAMDYHVTSMGRGLAIMRRDATVLYEGDGTLKSPYRYYATGTAEKTVTGVKDAHIWPVGTTN